MGSALGRGSGKLLKVIVIDNASARDRHEKDEVVARADTVDVVRVNTGRTRATLQPNIPSTDFHTASSNREVGHVILHDQHPGRNIVPVNIDGVAAGGAGIHCATRQQPVG